MLKNTFCHIPSVGARSEYRLWEDGIHSWSHIRNLSSIGLSPVRIYHIQKHIEKSQKHLTENKINFFNKTLPSREHWRLFPEFKNSVVYLDIETTGINYWYNQITTIALYDGKNIYHYIQGKNLKDFKRDIKNYNLLVTYNGKCFDIPFIENSLGVTINAAHIDLRYVLASLGYIGGLKGCERKLKIQRKDLRHIDGYFAVLLWNEYKRRKNSSALETLLAYNIQDVLNLEQLMTIAYNRKLGHTPFKNQLKIPSVKIVRNPFKVDKRVINKIKREHPWL
jgi:uncharacterized protein